jgi:hypothetical protein
VVELNFCRDLDMFDRLCQFQRGDYGASAALVSSELIALLAL